MDLKNFFCLKEKGLAGVYKVGKSYAISVQSYNPDGSLREPEFTGIGREEIAKRKAALQEQIDLLSAIEAEMDKLG